MDGKYIVYVKTNADGYITDVNSSAFLDDTAEWVEIDSGYGDKYHHAAGNYFPNRVTTKGGAYQYKLKSGKAVKCTAKDVAAQEEANKPAEQPSQLDRIEAQATYTAMMTDTLLGV